jgi:hypothetical protein
MMVPVTMTTKTMLNPKGTKNKTTTDLNPALVDAGIQLSNHHLHHTPRKPENNPQSALPPHFPLIRDPVRR